MADDGWEEGVGQLVEDPIDEVVLLALAARRKQVVQLLERRERFLVDRHDPAAGDVDVHLDRLRDPVGVLLTRAR